mgnify:FL=1
MKKINLIATAAFGLEAVVARELHDLGYADTECRNGEVRFTGTLEDIARTNLWLRCSDRVLVEIGRFEARTFDELFEGTKALPWEDWIGERDAFPVKGKAVRSTLMSVPDCQSIVKKAVVERLKLRYKKDWFPETGPAHPIEVAVTKDEARLTLDTSGWGLHKRGYRPGAGEAPLRETLAASLVSLSFYRGDRPFVDPFCGSGTILIEAALLGTHTAPGLTRGFVSEQWDVFPHGMWKKIREQAASQKKNSLPYGLVGYDTDEKVLKTARQNADAAGVGHLIDFHRQDIREFGSGKQYGCMITNPPYGERMGEIKEAEALYRTLGRVTRDLNTWSIYVITASRSFERLYGKKADRKRKLYNGRIRVDYYQYQGPRPPKL